MQAELAYRLAVREARRRFWLNLSYHAETVATTVTVLGTLAILMVPGVNRATTAWYNDIGWLHEQQLETPAAVAAEATESQLEAQPSISPDARIFPIPGQTHETAAFTSGYGWRKSTASLHRGHDYAAPIGTPLLAVESGTVEVWTENEDGSGCGNGLEIKAAKRSLIYCHMHTLGVKSGQQVKAGDVLGTVGSTGYSTGPHLHIGVIEDDEYIDPLEYMKSLPAKLERPETAAEATPQTGVDQAAVDQYFAEVSGKEFGDSGSRLPPMRDARIEVLGDVTEADRQELDRIMQELRELGAGDLQVVPSGGNVKIHFAPPERFAEIEPKYIAGNLGFFWIDSQGSSARILITSTNRVTQRERFHLLREELTQVLSGLGRDSNRHPNSIFQQGWTDVTEFSELDKAVIRMAFQ